MCVRAGHHLQPPRDDGWRPSPEHCDPGVDHWQHPTIQSQTSEESKPAAGDTRRDLLIPL